MKKEDRRTRKCDARRKEGWKKKKKKKAYDKLYIKLDTKEEEKYLYRLARHSYQAGEMCSMLE